MKEFSLIKKFSILSLGILLALGLTLGWLVNRSMQRTILQSAIQKNAAAVAFSIKSNFNPKSFAAPAATDADYARVARGLGPLLKNNTLSNITLWGTDRTALWSRNRDLVGRRMDKGEMFTEAVAGNVSTIISRTSHQSLSGEVVGRETILSLYVPVRFEGEGKVSIIVEASEEAGALFASIASQKMTIWAGIFFGLSLLYAALFTIVQSASRRMQSEASDMEDRFGVRLASSLVQALDAKSSWTRGHSDRVGKFSEAVAHKMGLGTEDIRNLKLAGLLHDIGKIGTYDYLLDKPAILTEEEFDVVKLHPEAGVKILQGINQLSKILPMIKHHHERFDGKGYPKGLKGKEIPIGARILHVTDSFEAITDDRPYRPARGYKEAIEELKRHSGTQFDPVIVDTFFATMGESFN